MRFAEWVRDDAGLSAMARAMGDIEAKPLLRSALDQRLRTAEGRRGSKTRRR